MKKETLIDAGFNYAAKRFPNEDGKHCGIVAQEQYACRKGFCAGYYWHQNIVWHANTEMPDSEVSEDGVGKACMVKEGKRVFLGHACRSTLGKYYFTDHTGIWHQIGSIDTWAYLEDLLPSPDDSEE